MAESATRKLWDSSPTRRHKRSQGEGDLVSDATRRVLIGGLASQRRPFHSLTTINHGIGPPGDLTHIHPVQEDRHE